METDIILTDEVSRGSVNSNIGARNPRLSNQTFNEPGRGSHTDSDYKRDVFSPNTQSPDGRGNNQYGSPLRAGSISGVSPNRNIYEGDSEQKEKATIVLQRAGTLSGGFNSSEIKVPQSNSKGVVKTQEVLTRATSILQRSYTIQKSEDPALQDAVFPNKSPIKTENLVDAALQKSQDITRKYSPSPMKFSPMTQFIKTDLKVSQELKKSQDIVKKYKESPAKPLRVGDVLRRSNTTSPLTRMASQGGVMRLSSNVNGDDDRSPWDLQENDGESPFTKKDGINELFTNYLQKSEVVLKQNADDLRNSRTLSQVSETEPKIRNAVSFILDPSPQKVDAKPRTAVSSNFETPTKQSYLFSNSLKEVSPPGFFTPKDDLKPIFVQERYIDGGSYKGDKLKELRHGRGEYIYSDGSKYEGEWNHGKRSGYGIFKLRNGQVIYDGEWKEDVYHGNGTLFNTEAQEEEDFNPKNFNTLGNNWWKFEGEFAEGQKNGLGSLIMVNNQKFVGKFRVGQVHGAGTYHRNNGPSISGTWDFNQLTKEL